MSIPLLEVRRILKVYGHIVALDQVDLALETGEIHALVGDNGAGKSTLVKILSGATHPTAGEILLHGKLTRFDGPQGAFDAGIVTVHQNLALVGCRTISQNLFLGREPTRFGLVLAGRMANESRNVLTLLRQMNIADINALVSDLSGGQRQAVSVARAVHQGGKILVLDEPTAALGVHESHRTLDLIEQMRGDERAILIVSHNLTHVFRIADRITVLRGGRKVGTVHKTQSSADDIVKMITGATLL